jgi:hypothetical protein
MKGDAARLSPSAHLTEDLMTILTRSARLRRSFLAAAPLAALSLAAGGIFGGHGVLAAGAGFGTPVVLQGGCGGEPSIDLDGKGDVYVSSPKGILAFLASCQGLATSTQGAATWVSNDGGSSFGPMISVGTLNGGGDTDTTVDGATGDVYVTDLEAAAADVCVSTDKGQTYHTVFTGAESCTTPFNFTGQAGPSNDREWLTVYGPTPAYAHKDVYLTYHDFATNLPEIWTSQDGGPFLPSVFPGITNPAFAASAANGTLIAKPVLDKDGNIYQLVATPSMQNGSIDQLWSVISTDHGQNFTATQIFDGSAAGANLGLVFNDLAIDGAGNLYALVLGNAAGPTPPDNVYLWVSTDKGSTWKQHAVPTDGKAVVLPALHGGPLAGELVFGFYHSTNTTDTNDLTGQWKYSALESTDANGAAPTFTTVDLGSGSNPATGIVHQGQICTAGLDCTTGQVVGPAGSGNRNLADFSSVTVDRNGCAIFVYADDGKIKPDQSNFDFSLVTNDVTRQTAGCFATAAATATASPTPQPSPTATPAAVATTLPNTSPASSAAPAGAAGAAAIAATLLLTRARRRRRR